MFYIIFCEEKIVKTQWAKSGRICPEKEDVMYYELYWRSSKYVAIDMKFYNHVYLWGFKGFKATSVDPAMANWGKLETEDDFVLPKSQCSFLFH